MEYTLQYLEDNDWIRITAIYADKDAVMFHAMSILIDGRVIRMLARNVVTVDKTWYTVKCTTDGLQLDRPVYGCPK